MKNKILPFVIGILVGAIITTVGFLIYEKTNTNNMMPNRERAGEMMNRGDGRIKSNRQNNNQNTTDSASDNI